MSVSRQNIDDVTMRGRMRSYDSYRHRHIHSVRSSYQPVAIKHEQPPTESIQKKAVNAASQMLNPPQSKVDHNQIAIGAVKNSKALSSSIFADQFSIINDMEVGFKKSRGKLQKVFYSFGTAVFVFAMFASAQTMFSNHSTKKQLEVLGTSDEKAVDDQGVSEGTSEEPSEDEPDEKAVGSYRVADPSAPRYLIIPELKVKSRIKIMGKDKNGAVKAPGNIFDAGWYDQSVKPGSDKGASLIVGHVSGWTKAGVFKKLHNLHQGSRFEVEKGSGEKLLYEVTKVKNYPVDNVPMGQILSEEEAGTHDLKLMTCGGKFDSKTDSYTERVVVYAKILK